MSSFTEPLVVKKIDEYKWMTFREFEYHVGSEDSNEVIKVPIGFITDFATVPRLFWIVLPPDGKYTQAAVLHDYLYYIGVYDRKKSDLIFLEAMGVLEVPDWKKYLMYYGVRVWSWISWNRKRKK